MTDDTGKMTVDDLVELLGPYEAKQLAGSILSEYGDQGEEAINKLLDRAAALEAEAREELAEHERDPGEETYVPDVWNSRPVYHRIKEREPHYMTVCGHQVTFRQGSVMMPLELSERIAHACGICFPPGRVTD